MYPPSTIRQIRNLLAQRKSLRSIARSLGVSRTLIRKVASGDETMTERTERSGGGDFEPIDPIRCGRCGATVVLTPCPACYHRAVTADRQLQSAGHSPA
jgi:hypothetical protein